MIFQKPCSPRVNVAIDFTVTAAIIRYIFDVTVALNETYLLLLCILFGFFSYSRIEGC